MNLGHALISDLINERYQMLFHNVEAPKHVTAITFHTPSKAVITGRNRIREAIVRDLGPDAFETHEASEFVYEGEEMPLDPDLMYLFLQYAGEASRLLLLSLADDKAKLHFH